MLSWKTPLTGKTAVVNSNIQRKHTTCSPRFGNMQFPCHFLYEPSLITATLRSHTLLIKQWRSSSTGNFFKSSIIFITNCLVVHNKHVDCLVHFCLTSCLKNVSTGSWYFLQMFEMSVSFVITAVERTSISFLAILVLQLCQAFLVVTTQRLGF